MGNRRVARESGYNLDDFVAAENGQSDEENTPGDRGAAEHYASNFHASYQGQFGDKRKKSAKKANGNNDKQQIDEDYLNDLIGPETDDEVFSASDDESEFDDTSDVANIKDDEEYESDASISSSDKLVTKGNGATKGAGTKPATTTSTTKPAAVHVKKAKKPKAKDIANKKNEIEEPEAVVTTKKRSNASFLSSKPMRAPPAQSEPRYGPTPVEKETVQKREINFPVTKQKSSGRTVAKGTIRPKVEPKTVRNVDAEQASISSTEGKEDTVDQDRAQQPTPPTSSTASPDSEANVNVDPAGAAVATLPKVENPSSADSHPYAAATATFTGIASGKTTAPSQPAESYYNRLKRQFGLVDGNGLAKHTRTGTDDVNEKREEPHPDSPPAKKTKLDCGPYYV